jgi:hypothetical protein
VRGKNIVWLPLIATLLSVLVLTPGFAAAGGTRLTVQPGEVYGGPGDRFSIDIQVRNVKDLFTFGFAVEFSPYAWTLVVSSVEEGPFLTDETSEFYYDIETFEGYVYVTGTRKRPSLGVDGTGILATIGFSVEYVGNSPLTLVDTELFNSYDPDGDGKGELIAHTTKDGFYYGPNVELLDDDVDAVPGHKVNVNHFSEVRFTSAVHNPGTMPLYVMTQFNIASEDLLANIQSGQTYIGDLARASEYLYVNSYSAWLEWDWINPGASVIGTPDGNYAESIVNGAMSSEYGFEDLTLGPYDFIETVRLQGYCRYPNGPTDAVDIDIYTTAPTLFDWLGSLYGGSDWGWVGPRWIDADVTDVLPMLKGNDPGPINSLSVLLYNYEGNAANPMQIDSLRLEVIYARAVPLFPAIDMIGPGETLELDDAVWVISTDLMGRYIVTASCWFSLDGATWIPAPETKSFPLTIFWAE